MSSSGPSGPIVCGVNRSRAARAAVSVAAGLADRLGAGLVLVHAVSPAPISDPRTIWYASELMELRENEGARLLEETVAKHDLVQAAERLVLFGDPSEQLAEVAARERASLLVVGARAVEPFERALPGRVSTDIARLAPCPVVMVPAPAGGLAAPEQAAAVELGC